MSIDYASIGCQIRKFRKERGLTQAQLAEQAGIEPSNLSHIERAATKLSLPTMVAIANALEVSLDELAYGSLVKSAHISVQAIDELLDDCSPEELKSLASVLTATKAALRNQ